MQIDALFCSRVATLAAKMVCDGWPHGTFQNPESYLPAGVPMDTACRRAGHQVWGGEGWWRKNLAGADACLRLIRWTICDDPVVDEFFRCEKEAQERWAELDAAEVTLMLLFVGHHLKQFHGERNRLPNRKRHQWDRRDEGS
jgi:hypothetical protein